jgi:hypothetical protein
MPQQLGRALDLTEYGGRVLVQPVPVKDWPRRSWRCGERGAVHYFRKGGALHENTACITLIEAS